MQTSNVIPRTATALAVCLIAMPLDGMAQAPERPQPPPSSLSRPGGSIADAGRDRPYERPPDRDYRLVSGDKLRIEVYKDAQLSQSLQVRPDGKITMPLIGDLEAAGRTSMELRDRITTSLKEYMTNPVVTVIVVEAQAPIAYVMGEVNHPGAIPIQGRITVLQALALAGGLRDFANTKNIRVLRDGIAGVQTIAFNYKDALRGVGQPVVLRPGDTVVVPD